MQQSPKHKLQSVRLMEAVYRYRPGKHRKSPPRLRRQVREAGKTVRRRCHRRIRADREVEIAAERIPQSQIQNHSLSAAPPVDWLITRSSEDSARDFL